MIDLFYEPVEIIESLGEKHGAEMSKEQSAFVCGLIKEYKPKKILEIGVAAGGTTVVMMNCCRMLGLNTEIYSVDLMKHYYRDASKQTGYLIEAAKTKLGKDKFPATNMYRGGIYLEFADEIGGDIDMVVLDTTHVLPGELLDFLSCLPVLHENSIVILHDISLNHSSHPDASDRSFATKVLFDTVVADKIIIEADSFEEYPNIAAFKINSETKKYISNVFSALTITWEYLLADRHIDMYKNFFEINYSSQMSNLFAIAAELNKQTHMRNIKRLATVKLNAMIDVCKIISNAAWQRVVYIYGCGNYGNLLFDFFNKINLSVDSFIVSSDQKLDQKAPLTVKHIPDILDEEKDFVIFVAMNQSFHQAVKEELEKYNVQGAVFIDQDVFKTLKNSL